MLFVKLTRADASSLIAGPYDDPIDANYQCKQLALGDPDPASRYEVVDAPWVITVIRPGSTDREVISWHETEDKAKQDAGFTQRADPSLVVSVERWPLNG